MMSYTRALILAIEVPAGNWKFPAKDIFIVLRHKINKVCILFNGCVMSIDLNVVSYLPIEGSSTQSADERCVTSPRSAHKCSHCFLSNTACYFAYDWFTLPIDKNFK